MLSEVVKDTIPFYKPIFGSGMFGNTQILSPSNFELAQQEIYKGQQAVWDREDSAVQRWVEDVKKAGLNPLAFTGSGSVTSSNNPAVDSLGTLSNLIGLALTSQRNYDSNAQSLLGNIIKVGNMLIGGIGKALS